MKLVIIADTHGNAGAWEAALPLMEGADVVVHCGDVLYHGPKFRPAARYNPPRLAELINACAVPVLICRGNGDSAVDQLVLEVPMQAPYVFAQIEGKRLLAAHGDAPLAEELLPLAEKWGVDYLFTGHTHASLVQRHNGVLHVNPGSPTYPLTEEKRLTCAVLVEGEAEIVEICP
jgi:putative phosphoesterase